MSITRLPTLELPKPEHLVSPMERLLAEALSVATSREVLLEVDSKDRFLRSIQRQCREVPGHQSRILQALEAGKRTEIGGMNGAIVEMAAETDVDVLLQSGDHRSGTWARRGVPGNRRYLVEFEVDEGIDGTAAR